MSKNLVNLTLRSKINVVLGSWMYTTHRLTVVHLCAKFDKQMSNRKKGMGRTRIHVKNPIYLTLRSKVNVMSGLWMCATHCLMVKHQCAKYGKPMSTKKIMGRTRICTHMDGRTDRLTDRQTEWFQFNPLNFVHRRGGNNNASSIYDFNMAKPLYTRTPGLEVLKFTILIDAFTSLLIITIYSICLICAWE